MYQQFLMDAKELKEILDENPDLPIVFVTRKSDYNDNDSPDWIGVEKIEVGKIMNKDHLLTDGIAMLSDEELRVMLRDTINAPDYDEDPHGYMKVFTQKAEEYKHDWKPVIIVHMDVTKSYEE